MLALNHDMAEIIKDKNFAIYMKDAMELRIERYYQERCL